MRSLRTRRIGGLAVAVLLYAALGWGFHGLQSACYDSRHAVDKQPPVGGHLTPLIDTLLWPLWLPISGSQSCEPAR